LFLFWFSIQFLYFFYSSGFSSFLLGLFFSAARANMFFYVLIFFCDFSFSCFYFITKYFMSNSQMFKNILG